jgi:hypothetical protein
MRECRLDQQQLKTIERFLPGDKQEAMTIFKNAGAYISKRNHAPAFERELLKTIDLLFPEGIERVLSFEHHGSYTVHRNQQAHVDHDDAMIDGKEYWTVVWYLTDSTTVLKVIDTNSEFIVMPRRGKVVAFPSILMHEVIFVEPYTWRSSIVSIVQVKNQTAVH